MVTGQKSIMPVSNSIPTFRLAGRILDKIYQPNNTPQMTTPHRRNREEY